MFCPKCGKEMPEGIKFCTNCGLNLEAFFVKTVQQPAPAAQPEPAAPAYQQPAPQAPAESGRPTPAAALGDDFINIPDGVEDEELPFN